MLLMMSWEIVIKRLQSDIRIVKGSDSIHTDE